jgi:hypothetical protein
VTRISDEPVEINDERRKGVYLSIHFEEGDTSAHVVKPHRNIFGLRCATFSSHAVSFENPIFLAKTEHLATSHVAGFRRKTSMPATEELISTNLCPDEDRNKNIAVMNL